jgi:DNA-binding transcriptional MerR regulator
MEKLYYSISEVARMFGMEQSHLRYWESVFDQLKPRRNAQRTRFYTKEDIKTIKEISFLVNEQKLTLKGAKKKLGEKKDQVSKQQEISERLRAVKKELQGIARFLQEE